MPRAITKGNIISSSSSGLSVRHSSDSTCLLQRTNDRRSYASSVCKFCCYCYYVRYFTARLELAKTRTAQEQLLLKAKSRSPPEVIS